ncbi:MAG: Gfo/Idh/MocA family oxidoreductase [Ruminococcaceae bacterium]|nr:Gfo/Idh/MocA family oxidoreductase [Oscillospiraceae bacterium]
MKKIRLGLIGCGKMMASHVSGVQYVDTVEIVSVCDVFCERAEEVANALGNNPKIYTNYRDMVDDVDAVMIALPHDLHFECGMFFVHHNKHILMEKPLCNSEEECLILIEECEKRNLKLMCAYPVPFFPAIIKLKELVDSGEYGEIMQMSIWTEQLTVTDITSNNPWGATARLGGGQLFSHGCHYIDLLLRFLGEPIEGAHVGTKNGTPWMLREGTSALVIKFKNGAIGYHGATWGARGSRMSYDYQVMMEKGLLDLEWASGEIRLYNGNGEHKPLGGAERQQYDVIWKRDEGRGKATQYEIRHFADCIINDKKPLTDGRSALQSLRVIWALYDAEKNHRLADLRGLGLENC